MSTQNLNIGPNRSSGHKEATEDHTTAAKLDSQGEGGDPKGLLQNRLLNSDRVGRAALFDQDDFLCVASSKKPFDLEPDQVRKILDGMLTFARQGDPTMASGDGHPPTKLHVGSEGTADVTNGTADYIQATLNGKPFVAARSATYVLLVEGVDGTDEGALITTIQSFTQGLEELTL
ncbi:hypothetical protein BD324DRAFT_617276 [Kockovaella imperatae]|uniref:Profilin n=1 Tax=Kockovaella imperatae TaxID=4999 RepID=A0A1Y1UQJ8_9TREE|nr:hypothetical protein BD324DRAFT_617276 [Kockovaella imperatae]ORX40313.1 hypothetical protein BD324DRAFT_617276 [Kockovaella imperatae]